MTKITRCTLHHLIVVFSLFTTTFASAATYFVAKSGNDANSCSNAQSQNTAKLTVTSAIACMASGDRLEVKAGTYPTPTSLPPSGTSWSTATTLARFGTDIVVFHGPLIISNSGPRSYLVFDGLTIDAQNAANETVWVGNGSHHIRIANSDIKNAREHGISAPSSGFGSNQFINNKIHDGGTASVTYGLNAMYISSPNNLVERNEIYRWRDNSIQIYTGDWNLKTSGTIVRYNWIHDTSGSLNNSTCGQGIFAWNGDNIEVYGNIINNLYGDRGQTCGAAISASHGKGIKIYNNTIYNNNDTAISISASASDTLVKNNIIWSNANDFWDQSASTIKSNNLCTSPNVGCSVVSDPLFIDRGNSNFKLQSGSPGIDAGTSTGLTWDYSGSAPDIGAYELFSTTAISSIQLSIPSVPLNVRMLQ